MSKSHVQITTDVSKALATLRKEIPDTMQGFGAMAKGALKDGALSELHKELIALAKRQPGRLNYGSAGAGGINHLVLEQLKMKSGIFITHIPYRGIAPATLDMVSGQIEIITGTIPALAPYVRDGRIKALAVTSAGRSAALPEVPGLAERWGRSVFHCPYCHGYELEQGPIGVLATSPMSLHHALMLPDWGPTTLFTNQCFEPDAEQKAQLLARGVVIEPGKVLQILGKADVQLSNGKVLQMAGLFTQPTTTVNSPLAEQLGCQFEQGPMGAFIQTSASKETTIAGVFACGDNARMAGSVAIAIGDGSLAGAMTHQSLLFGTISH